MKCLPHGHCSGQALKAEQTGRVGKGVLLLTCFTPTHPSRPAQYSPQPAHSLLLGLAQGQTLPLMLKLPLGLLSLLCPDGRFQKWG